MSPRDTAATETREVGIHGLPRDASARRVDPTVDYGAISAFIGNVNLADGNQSAPSAEDIAVDWRPAPGFDPARDALVVDDGNGIAGLVNVDAQVRSGKVVHWIEGWVRQDRRRQGIGRALLAWAERHTAELVERGEGPAIELPHVLGFGALESNPAALAFAASTGYARIRYGFEMRRSLDEPLPDAAVPAGIELRAVREADHQKIWDADIEAFLDHWEPRERDEGELAATLAHPDVDTSLWRVAWAGDEVVGSVMNWVYADENARVGLDIGWLAHVSVRKPWRGRGVAKALIASSLLALRDRGMSVAALGVDGENPTGALALYEGLGFTRHESWISHRKTLDPAAVLRGRTS